MYNNDFMRKNKTINEKEIKMAVKYGFIHKTISINNVLVVEKR